MQEIKKRRFKGKLTDSNFQCCQLLQWIYQI